MENLLYFAYGSNMNLGQMAFRCPDGEVVEVVRLEDYRLTFCGNARWTGVATVLPQAGSYVDGVLWRISREDEKHLDFYEGYPHLYGKERIWVTGPDGRKREVMAYIMNQTYKDHPVPPSALYLKGILEGCRENGIDPTPIQEEALRLEQQRTRTRGANKSVQWEDR